MPVSCRTLFPVALALASGACSRSTAPAEPSATVTVQRLTLTAAVRQAGSATRMEFSIPVRIDNLGPAPLTFHSCTSRVEAPAADKWTTVWQPICLAENAGPAEIPPGGSREFTVAVWATIEGPGAPRWLGADIGGTYRFVAGLVPRGIGGLIPTVPSNAFTLVSGTAMAQPGS
jgi:hypothetical protein